MGWIKDAKAEAISKEAQRALDEGRTVFVCRVNQGSLQSNYSGSLSGVAEQIEAVEALGWKLIKRPSHMTTGTTPQRS